MVNLPACRFGALFLSFSLIFNLVSSPFLWAQDETSIPGLEASQIKVIDDFNSNNVRNQVGGLWKTGGTEGTSLQYALKKYDALNNLRGLSCRLTYQVPVNGEVYFETDLNHLDISKAKELRFWIMRASEDEHRLWAFLEDDSGNQSRLQVKRFSKAEDRNGAQEVRIPLNEFYNVDKSSLQKFRLIIRGEGPGVSSGVLFFDHLVFVGNPGVVFESLADNLAGFPKKAYIPDFERLDLASLPSEQLLLKVAEATWKNFANLVDQKTHLPVDNIQVAPNPEIGDYTSPTNIGLYFLACVSAVELGFITREEAVHRIQDTFKTLKKLSRWKGFFYNFYNTTNMQVTRKYVSAIDSGWLAASLMVVRKAFPRELANQCDKFLKEMDFSIFYDKSIGQIRLGYDETEKSMAPFHYGLLVSESRLLSFVAIAKGNVPDEHWHKINRTPPPEWDWQTQKPVGDEKEINGKWTFKGMYRYHDYYIVPSWGGSLFEFLMPTLLMKEKELSPQGLGKNDLIATRIHVQYALNEKRYPVWGISPCSYPGGYGEFGVKEIGVKGYRDFGIITPHASMLALDFQPKSVISNLRTFLKTYRVWGEYGLYDSVKVRGRNPVTCKYLALDQGMILVSITNYLKRGAIRNYFHKDPGVKRSEYLLEKEKFFS